MTKADTWMPFYVGAYVANTMHLTTEQHGAYLLLLLHAWKRGGLLPAADNQLAAITKLAPAQWRKHRAVLMAPEFFERTEESYVSARVVKETEKAQSITGVRSVAGIAGAEARWSEHRKRKHANGEAMANAMANTQQDPSQSDRPSQLQKKKLSPEAKEASSESAADGGVPMTAREFVEAIWQAQPVLGGKRRATKPDVAKAYAAAVKRGGEAGEIIRACQAYYRLPACTKDGGQFAMGAAVLLEADRWREYLPTVFEGAANSWTGPASLREAVVAEASEAFARSYLDSATWIDPQSEDVCGSVIARNGYAHDKLKGLHCLREIAHLLQPRPKDQAA